MQYYIVVKSVFLFVTNNLTRLGYYVSLSFTS
jgi:hypothetical protein